MQSLGLIDHVGLSVSDMDRATSFYAAALAPLGIGLVMEFPAGPETGGVAVAGFGRAGKGEFWIAADGKTAPRVHIAFLAADRASVDAFYQAAIAAGGTDNGAPGVRAVYHPDYYGAFVLDPDGNNIEAVCHRAP
jgi:catechol 2,3-dioxygenase-like lactoylglutathione lyase family enzyme